MNKKIISFLMIGVLLISYRLPIRVLAEAAKVEIWSYSLDERVEHRSIKVGSSMANFGIMITPESVSKTEVKWSTDNEDVARAEGDDETATVYGLKEGTTTLHLAVSTKSDGVLKHSSIISVYKPINNVSGQVSAKATFWRGADKDSWVRSTDVPVGQKVTIIGSCGNYYYLELPNDYVFDDNRATRYTYALKSQIFVPVTGIKLDKKYSDIAVGKNVVLNKVVTPDIATNKAVSWSSSEKKAASVDNDGNTVGKSEGYAVIMAKTNSGNKTATCNVSVYKPIGKVNAKIKETTNLLIGANEKEADRSKVTSIGQSLSIVGTCGNYYYVELPADYVFDDGGTSRNAYVLKSKVYIPVTGIKLNKVEVVIGDKQTEKLVATVLPDIATNKKVIWSVNKNNIVTVDKNGTVTGKNGGSAVIIAKTESEEKTALCKVEVVKNLPSTKLGDFKLSLVRTDLDVNVVKYTRCDGATEYTLYQGTKRFDGTIKWEDVYESYGKYENGAMVPVVSIELGKTYYYKVVAKKEYARAAFDFITIGTKESNIIKVETGKPNLSVKLSGKKKVKLSWGKLSDYEHKKGGYEIYRKANKQKAYAKIKKISTQSTTKFIDKQAKYNTNYTYKIRAFYLNKKKKTVYSPYSKAITVKTKKKK